MGKPISILIVVTTAISISIFLLYILKDSKILTVEKLDFSKIGNFQEICVSSQFEFPDQSFREFSLERGRSCWGNVEVPYGEIYITVLRTDLKCDRFKMAGHLLYKNNSETRCFPYEHAPRVSLSVEDGIAGFSMPRD